jgi:hypothetical protein
MMIDYNKNRKDLQIDKLHEDLVAELEVKAAELEVPVDYYIAEFTNLCVDKTLNSQYTHEDPH